MELSKYRVAGMRDTLLRKGFTSVCVDNPPVVPFNRVMGTPCQSAYRKLLERWGRRLTRHIAAVVSDKSHIISTYRTIGTVHMHFPLTCGTVKRTGLMLTDALC